MRVLVLDDSFKDFLYILETYGARDGVEFRGVATAAEAENLLRQEKFDALLLDGNLDDEGRFPTGPAVLRSWLQTGIAVPPVFMISGDDSLNAEGVMSGAQGILGKPELWNLPRMLKGKLLKWKTRAVRDDSRDGYFYTEEQKQRSPEGCAVFVSSLFILLRYFAFGFFGSVRFVCFVTVFGIVSVGSIGFLV